MNFGAFHLYSLPPWMSDSDVINQELEQACWLEELGFDEAWLAEHNAREYGIVGSLQVTAAALAARTKRIRIGAAVSRLPLHHPLHTAEDLALVDVISNGRFDLGFGKGYDPLEFETYGVDFEERDGRWEEALDIVLRIWTRRPHRPPGQVLDDPGDGAVPEAGAASAPARLPHGHAELTSPCCLRPSASSRHHRPGPGLGRRQAQGAALPRDRARGGPRRRRHRAGHVAASGS